MRSLVLLLVLGFSSSVFALSPRTQLNDSLSKVMIDGEKTAYTATLSINFVKNTMKVEIYDDPCGQMRPVKRGEVRCMAASVLKDTLEAPLTHRKSSCGSGVYLGTQDDTRFDGLRTTIKVTDHATRACNDYVVSDLIVQVLVYNPWTNQSTEYTILK